MNRVYKLIMLGSLLCLVAAVAHASTWSQLWWTPDQQGQRLLEQHQPAQAAKMFRDGRRQGFAELEAGQYAQAATQLSPFKDADSQYNRGNALARAGQLEAALGAYDAALTVAPGDRDAIKNRALVAQALTKKEQQQNKQTQAGHAGQASPPSSGGSGESRASGDAARAGGNSAGAEQENKGGEQGRPGSRSQGSSAAPSDQTDVRHSQQSSGAAASVGGQAGDRKIDSATREAAASAQSTGSESQSPARVGSAGAESGAVDRADGHEAQGIGAPRGGDGAVNPSRSERQDALLGEKSDDDSGKSSPPPASRSEQAIALDQWLRSLPDDSAELLQRKFMIEHLLNQRRNEP